MEKEEKKYVNKAEEDEMVMNSVNVFFIQWKKHIFRVFCLKGAVHWEVDCVCLNQFSNFIRLSLAILFGIKKLVLEEERFLLRSIDNTFWCLTFLLSHMKMETK